MPTPKESDYRYWLGLFGVSVPVGQSALALVASAGMPEELADLAKDFAAQTERVFR